MKRLTLALILAALPTLASDWKRATLDIGTLVCGWRAGVV